MQKRTNSLLLILAVIALLGTGISILVGTSTTRWVGHTDVTVRFVVTDAATGAHLPGALVHINTDTPESRPDPETPQFILTTDARGEAEYQFHQIRCSGGRGLFEISYNLALPYWDIHATCTQYEPEKEVRLVSPETQRQVKPGARDRVISIPIRLARAAR